MIVCPFVILIDSKEQLPYRFENMRADRKKVFVWTRKCHLKTADYSIRGFENQVCVERKSLADLYQTLGQGRERFLCELERMQDFEYAAVVIEATWQQIADPTSDDPLWHSKMHPNSIIGTIVSFARQFPKTRWKAAGNRANAEKMTFDILLKFYKHVQNGIEIHTGNTGTDHQPTELSEGIRRSECAFDR